ILRLNIAVRVRFDGPDLVGRCPASPMPIHNLIHSLRDSDCARPGFAGCLVLVRCSEPAPGDSKRQSETQEDYFQPLPALSGRLAQMQPSITAAYSGTIFASRLRNLPAGAGC